MALAHVIMTALIEEQRQTGYDLAKYFDTSLGFFWKASHQQIYSELRKLETKQWLSSIKVPQQGKPDKIEYQLTEKGRLALEEWVYTSTKPRVVKDELLVKMYNLSDSNQSLICQQIKERKLQVEKSLALYVRIKASHYSDPKKLSKRMQGIYLVLVDGIADARVTIDWCNHAIELIEN